MEKCKKCGALLKQNYLFCGKCGTPVTWEPPKTAAAPVQTPVQPAATQPPLQTAPVQIPVPTDAPQPSRTAPASSPVQAAAPQARPTPLAAQRSGSKLVLFDGEQTVRTYHCAHCSMPAADYYLMVTTKRLLYYAVSDKKVVSCVNSADLDTVKGISCYAGIGIKQRRVLPGMLIAIVSLCYAVYNAAWIWLLCTVLGAAVTAMSLLRTFTLDVMMQDGNIVRFSKASFGAVEDGYFCAPGPDAERIGFELGALVNDLRRNEAEALNKWL